MSSYPTNLTDKQWQVMKNIVEHKVKKTKTSFTKDDDWNRKASLPYRSPMQTVGKGT